MSKTTVDTLAVLGRVQVGGYADPRLTWFDTVLKHWHREAGSKPTAAMLAVPLLLGKRPGVEALHIAMTLRPEGCTVQQFCLAGSCGPANNYRRALVKSGWFSCTVTGKPYAFTLGFTAKGEAKVIAAQAALAQVATDKPTTAKRKPAGKRKPKPATPVAVEQTPATEPLSGPVTVVTDAQADAVEQPTA